MKQINLDEYTNNPFQFTPACESFIDAIKSIFSGNNQHEETAEKLKKAQWPLKISELKKHLADDLSKTYNKADWINRNLPEKTTLIKISAMTIAIYDDKPLTSPAKVLSVARAMFTTYKEIAQNEKTYIELRKQLIQKIESSSNPNATAEKLWSENKNKLNATAADRWRAKKKSTPAFGSYSDVTKGWPAAVTAKANSGFSWESSKKGTGEFQIPSRANAKEYTDTILELFNIVQEIAKMREELYIPDWEGSGIDHDTLKDGDAIYTKIYSDDKICGVPQLGRLIEVEFARIITALYIVMFSKRE